MSPTLSTEGETLWRDGSRRGHQYGVMDHVGSPVWRDGPTPGVPLWGHNGRRGTPPNLTIKTQTSPSSVGSTVSNKSENSLLSCHVYLINMR